MRVPRSWGKYLFKVAPKLPDDYEPWGQVDRDQGNEYLPDCSNGCKWFLPLADTNKEHLGMDWGVCANPNSHRCGLLTFEHQGCGAYDQWDERWARATWGKQERNAPEAAQT